MAVAKPIPKHIPDLDIESINSIRDLRNNIDIINDTLKEASTKKQRIVLENYGLKGFYERFTLQEHFDQEELIAIKKSCLKKAPQTLLINYFVGEPDNKYPIHMRGRVAEWLDKNIHEEPKVLKARALHEKTTEKCCQERLVISRAHRPLILRMYDLNNSVEPDEENNYIKQYKKDFKSFTQG